MYVWQAPLFPVHSGYFDLYWLLGDSQTFSLFFLGTFVQKSFAKDILTPITPGKTGIATCYLGIADILNILKLFTNNWQN